MTKDGKKKNIKITKTVDLKALEDQAIDIISRTDVPDIDQIELPEDIKRRLEEAGPEALQDIERELGLNLDFLSITGDSEEFEGIKIEDQKLSMEGEDEQQIDDSESRGEIEDIEEVVDGAFDVLVAPDKMGASIDLYPSRGRGKPLSIERIKEKIQRMGIVFGVNYELLKKLIDTVENTKVEKTGVVFARGTEPEEGKDGSIEFNFSEREDVLNQEVEKLEREGKDKS